MERLDDDRRRSLTWERDGSLSRGDPEMSLISLSLLFGGALAEDVAMEPEECDRSGCTCVVKGA